MNALSILAGVRRAGLDLPGRQLRRCFGTRPLGFVESTLPIILFCILFGLSMDYEVFLLTRIREVYEPTGDNARPSPPGWSGAGG